MPQSRIVHRSLHQKNKINIILTQSKYNKDPPPFLATTVMIVEYESYGESELGIRRVFYSSLQLPFRICCSLINI
jgi:hypothetical protein